MSALPSPEVLRALIARVPIILFAIDRDGVVTVSEGGALQTAARAPGEAVGRTNDDLHHERPAVLDAVARALAGEEVAITLPIYGRIYDILYMPTHDAAGAVEGIVGLAIDVTSRVEAEEAYRGIFDGAQEGIFRLTADGRAQLANPALARLLGYDSVGAFLATGRDLASYFVADTVRAELYARLLAEESVTGFEAEVRRHDGTIIWLSINARLLRDADSTVIGSEGRAEDITARKQAELALAASEERFRLLIAGVQDYAIFSLDPDGRVASWNVGATRLKGYAAAEIIGQGFARFYTPDDVARGKPATLLQAAIADGRVEDEGWRVRRDGSRFWATVTITALRDATGVLRGFGKVTRDNTARRDAEAALRASEERYRRAFDDAAIGMALVAPDGRYLQVNPALCTFLCRTADELLATDYQTITHPDDLAADMEKRRATLRGEIESFQIEKRYLLPDGRAVWGQLSVSLARDADGTPLHFLSQIQDIDARKAAEEQLRHQALHDPLTGLPNRALFLDQLTGALARRLRREEQIGVCFLDLDGFKAVNDGLGHAAGDMLLAAIGARLRLAVRAGDTVARFGGDEFTILLEGGIAAADLPPLIERLIAATEGPLVIDGRTMAVSASIGVALSPPIGDTAEALLAAADGAMYAAKALGRGRWLLADRDSADAATPTD